MPTIPVGSEARRLRFLFDTKSGATPSSGVEEYWDGNVNWVTPEDLGKLSDRYVRNTRRQISEEGYNNCGVSLAPPGSIVLSKRAPIGQTAILGAASTCNQGCFLLAKKNGVDERFYFYSLIHLRPALEALGRGSTFMELSADDLRSILLPFPNEERQRLIANYLDHETARIDRLIAEKQRMLALLEEKRAALISRVVTRGLDPNALLKPSGQEWLGEIPAHWEILRIKFITAALDQGTSPIAANTPAGAGELGVLKLSAVSKGRFKREENKALREAGENEQAFALRKGDVLITRGNTPELVADVACVPGDEPNLLLPDLIYRLRVQEGRIIPEYLTYLLTTAAARVQIRRDARGSSGSMVKVSQVHVLDWLTPLPPISEQTEIVDYLQLAVERFQSMMREVSSSLSLLSERRAALITATVTGQIDVEGTNMNERGHHGTR
ncbi:MAG: restriction endonuclease subunit S [Candidatus Accumulibacter sp. UW26]|jgi:type I restriction enzyme S subunit|uniref:Restriction endonuclease subunit S n=1 Tax=Candidatus Accumulibacter contiguus TaxID=2954381 RepID=A0ABX1TGV2_9PROT|nr:restriction endonuclease subunit S [Candidatus Accumulibacter contiguus]NMQ07691.1 restriction endonuclease subunit S [Candidatus Accumulibacter contiguus]